MDYVMFGESHFFGDLTDIIAALGGRLKTIVLNMPPKQQPGRLSLRQRLDRLDCTVRAMELKDWHPGKNEQYIIGFSGRKMEPLVTELKEKFGIVFSNLIHPTAIVPPSAKIAADSGIIINSGVVIGAYTEVAPHVIVNRGVTTGHDSKIFPYVFLAPSAVLCGYTIIMRGAFIGANATILPDITVGCDSIVAAGSVVTEAVPDYVMVAGVPAAVKKVLIDG